MKRILLLLVVLLITACGTKNTEEERTVLKVGGTYPLIEIFNQAAPELEAHGIKLEITEFNDYVTPNIALDEGEIDANLFQHLPYLEGFNVNKKTDLTDIGNVLLAPIGIYSERYSSLEELPEGAEFGISNSPVDQGRCLLILQSAGLIKIDNAKGIKADLTDITDNPNNIKFKVLDAAMLARALKDLDAAFINGNFAIQAGLKPAEDSIYREGTDSPYVNVVAVKKGRETDENLQKLVEAIQTDEIRDYIKNNFDGAFVPAF